MPSKGKGVRVRGTCKVGHTTEATSNPGRVTWNGPCGHDGCDLQVRATRVTKDAGKPPPTARMADAAAAGDDAHAVKEIAGYAQPKQDQRNRRAAEGGAADVPPAGGPQQPAGSPDGGSGGSDPGPGDSGPAERHGEPQSEARAVDSQRRDPATGKWSGGRARFRARVERGRARSAERKRIEREQGIYPHIIPR